MLSASGNKKIILEGRGPLTLRSSDYLASGGEGVLYRINGTVIKLYADTDKMERENIADKIRLLAKLKHKYVMSPEGIVTDPQGKAMGFYLPYAEGEPLARVFATSFRQRNKFGDNEAMILVDRMREAVRFAHDNKAIMVDPNEFNWLVYLLSRQGPEPRVIDIDSWAIGYWQARAIMPSIRDWHSKTFNELTDWFAWGIVTFQIFTGIHPYKGGLDGFKNNDLETRMKTNTSVFYPGVRLNRAVRDFNCIPGLLLEWYKAAFQKGERTIPPSPFDKGVGKAAPAALTYRVVTASAGSLVFDLLLKMPNDSAVKVWPCGIVLMNSGALFDLSSRKIIAKMISPDGEAVKVENGWLIADHINDNFGFYFIDDRTCQTTPLSFSLMGYRLFRYENRLFLITENELVELKFMIAGKPLLAVGQRIRILQPKSVRWFEGVGIQEAMGAVFLITPFGDASFATLRVKELDGLYPVTAKAGSRFITLVAADKNGSYYKIDIVPDKNYASYRINKKMVDGPELNIAILPKGVCATIEDDGELIIFVPTSDVVNKVSDKYITTDAILADWNNRVLYIRKGEVWSVRMK